MTNACIFSEKKEEIEPFVRNTGFSLVDERPDLVISYGGDGTFMRAETAFPGVPKLVLKGSRICNFCSPLPNEEMLRRAFAGALERRELMKLDVTRSAPQRSPR